MKSQINLWITPIEADLAALPVSYVDILDPPEEKRYGRLRTESDRRQYLISHVLLRTVLSHTVQGKVRPDGWQFTKSRNGRPRLATVAGLPCLHFNLSHCKRLAVAAVSSTCPVGVDVERLGRTLDPSFFGIVLSPGEREWLKSRSRAVKTRDFIRLWTAKEAYSKLLGQGLLLDFSSFEVALDPIRMVRTETGVSQPNDLYLETREIQIRGDSFHVSLAARVPPAEKIRVDFHVLDSLQQYQ